MYLTRLTTPIEIKDFLQMWNMVESFWTKSKTAHFSEFLMWLSNSTGIILVSRILVITQSE